MKKFLCELLGVVVAGFSFIPFENRADNTAVSVNSEVVEESAETNEVIIGYYELGRIDELVPQGGYMVEEDLRNTIHYMSHQKVHADNKFGRKILITKDLVVGLEKMLDNYDYEYESLYREILSEWKEAKFENAVAHHNALWEIDGGDVGKATRLLTEEEEQAYIARYEQDNETKYNSKKLEYSFD